MSSNRIDGRLPLLVMIAGALAGCAGGTGVDVAEENLGFVFSVDSPDDLPDATPGDGVCGASNGFCTLRAAVQESNAIFGPDTIVLGTGVYRVTLGGSGEDAAATGDLDVNEETTIRGEGPFRTRIVASSGDRVFHLRAPQFTRRGSVVIRDLAIEGGTTTANGGGVFNDLSSVTTLSRVRVVGNEANRGGGVSNVATARLTLIEVVVHGNHAVSDGGGVGSSGVLSADLVTIDGNRADGGAGGLFGGGSGVLRRSTISRNDGGFRLPGGAAQVGGTFTFDNVTISGNVGDPSGVWVGGRADFVQSTITDNAGGALMNCDGCGARTTLANTIVSASELWPGVNCAGTITSLGGNIDDGAGCGLGATGDRTWTDPMLQPLDATMGPTEMHAPSAGSPAIDGALSSLCTSDDQRAVPRPQGAGCDVGAYEHQVDRFCIDSLEDEVDDAPGDGLCRSTGGRCTLRAAIMETNALPGPDSVGFCVDGRFALRIAGAGDDDARTGDLDVNDHLTLHGNGRATEIDASGLDRGLDVGPGGRRAWVDVRELTLEGGNVGAGTGGFGGGVRTGPFTSTVLRSVVVYGNTAVYGVGLSGAGGGGISSEGVLVLERVHVDKNRATGTLSIGGGILCSGSLRAVDSVIYGGVSGQDGGGLFVGAPGGTADLTRTEISSNYAAHFGGGIEVAGNTVLVLRESTVDANYAAYWGGGAGSYGRLEATDTTFSRNSAASYGGGLWATTSASTVLERVTMWGNTSSYVIAGSAIDSTGALTLTNGTISGNTGTGNALVLSAGTLTNVTIADNDGGVRGSALRLVSTVVGRARTGASCGTTIVSLGHNLDYDGSCGLAAAGDQPGVDPQLAALANNGGLTFTQALGAGSRAIDAGDASRCPATDQRGHGRVGICDVGAYEAP